MNSPKTTNATTDPAPYGYDGVTGEPIYKPANPTNPSPMPATNPYISLITSGLSAGGNIWLNSLKNKGAEIDGVWKTEYQKLLNANNLSQGQLQVQLTQLSAARDTVKDDAKTKQTKSLLTMVAVLIGIGGVVALAIILTVRAVPKAK